MHSIFRDISDLKYLSGSLTELFAWLWPEFNPVNIPKWFLLGNVSLLNLDGFLVLLKWQVLIHPVYTWNATINLFLRDFMFHLCRNSIPEANFFSNIDFNDKSSENHTWIASGQIISGSRNWQNYIIYANYSTNSKTLIYIICGAWMVITYIRHESIHTKQMEILHFFKMAK